MDKKSEHRYTVNKIKRRLKTSLLIITLIFFVFFNLFLLLWIVEGSFKTEHVNRAIPPHWIFTPTIENYKNALPTIARPFLNSLTVSVVSVLVSLLLAMPAAYALARFKIKGKDSIGIWVLSMRMGSPFAFVFSFFLIMRNLGLLDTLLALIILYTAFNLSLAIWLLKGFVEDLPPEIEESALVDGCTRLQTLRYISLPLLKPGIFVVAMLCFLFSWNEYLMALVLTRREAITIPVAISMNISFMNINWEAMCVFSTISLLPAVILTILLRNYLVRGLTFGSIKG